jgi:carboxyl-terminal processing protease
LAKPFDYNKNESIELDGEKRGYSKNDTELKEHWRKMLKYEVLSKITSKLEEQEKDNSKDRVDATKKDDKTVVPKEKKTFDQIEIDSRKDVLKTFDDWYKRLNKAKRMDQLSDYLNCITNIYDPHTGYFEPKDKQKFDTEMSGRFEGIGARLQQENDYIKVSEIIPGGPAYRQKELEAKDLIMKVAQKDGEPVDIAGMDMDDVVSMIKGKKGTEVRLTVKKVDGTMKVVTIIRDEVVVDEGFAKSLILNTKSNGEKIGYIKLPRFYADFENPNGRTCSQDVATEIGKLDKENVQGIILDLRWNGGGSLRDVIDMSGMFVDKGPMVQVKGRSNKVEVYDDTEAGVLWDKPIIILVNQGSASASEIIAAALQDYGRAVIVGAKGTYGKGTVQRFVDLDKLVGNTDVKPLGQVKLTIQKFYRINGGSTQLRGVTPDIILPDAYNYIEVGEKENEYPMEWNEVAAAKYEKTNSIKDMAALRNKSEARVKRDATFVLLEENAKRLKKQKDDTKYPIGMKEYREYVAKKKDENKKYEDMFKPIDDISSINLDSDLYEIKADSSHIGRNDDFIKGTKKDIQLYETMNIMHDLIKQK